MAAIIEYAFSAFSAPPLETVSRGGAGNAEKIQGMEQALLGLRSGDRRCCADSFVWMEGYLAGWIGRLCGGRRDEDAMQVARLAAWEAAGSYRPEKARAGAGAGAGACPDRTAAYFVRRLVMLRLIDELRGRERGRRGRAIALDDAPEPQAPAEAGRDIDPETWLAEHGKNLTALERGALGRLAKGESYRSIAGFDSAARLRRVDNAIQRARRKLRRTLDEGEAGKGAGPRQSV